MYWLYNEIKAQDKTDHNIRQGSSLWLNLVDVEQLWEDASVRNGKCGSDPLRWRGCSDLGFTLPTWVLVLAEEVATTISNFIMWACYLTCFHYKYFKRERFHFGLNKVCSTTQSNILQFSLWAQIKHRYLYYRSVQTDFSPTLIYLSQPPNWKFIQMTLRVWTSLT